MLLARAFNFTIYLSMQLGKTLTLSRTKEGT